MASQLSKLSELRERLLHALTLDLPYTERLLIPGGRQASVLVLLGFPREPEAGPSLLITRRTEQVATHKGQMAFPGGMCEPGDLGLYERTALRETEEEVGLPPSGVETLGKLPELVTGTGFRVVPVVALLRSEIEAAPLRANLDELEEAFWVSLETLATPGVYGREWYEHAGVRFPTHVYQVGVHKIWGATGAMIKNLLDRLAALS